MGQCLEEEIKKNKYFILIGLSSSQKISNIHNETVVIDFSNSIGNESLLDFSEQSKSIKNLIICATALESSNIERWQKYSKDCKARIILAPNTSIGVLQTLKAAAQIAKTMTDNNFDIRIEETHHKNKIDSPSGTIFLKKYQKNCA